MIYFATKAINWGRPLGEPTPLFLVQEVESETVHECHALR